MPAKFRVYAPGVEPFERAVNNTATIGRTADNTIALPGSHVSRQHAIVRCHNGFQYQLMDLGSRNGTYVNDQRVIMPVTLESGARVRIANYELVFDQTPDDDPGANVDATLAAVSMEGHQAVLSVAILVCDIRGFSAISETRFSQRAVSLTNTLGTHCLLIGRPETRRGLNARFVWMSP